MTQIRSTPIERMLEPFQKFFHVSAAGGIVLIISTVLAMFWANSPWSETYHAIWETKLSVGLGQWAITKSLEHWINDGLMTVFFFVVGLEIKREVLVGDLSSLKKASLPIAAAVGGMIVPALLFMAFNHGKPTASGWGTPMATDIAFALGVLSLLGKRVPLSLKVFLAALAIVDDIGAVLVIALFYTSGISWLSLAAAGALFLVLVICNRLGVRKPLVYALVGAALWLAFLKSGIHATVAGVLAALTIPASTLCDASRYLVVTRRSLDNFEEASKREDAGVIVNEDQVTALQVMSMATNNVTTPLQRLEVALHPWSAFLIMPIFALANAGVSLEGLGLDALTHSSALGILVGLVIGKQIGVFGFSWLFVRLGLVSRLEGVSWRQVYGAACLAGIGFTMSMFIGGLAFATPELLNEAKLAIIVSSVVSASIGSAVLIGAAQSEPAPA